MLKPFSGEKFNFHFATQEGTSLCRTASFDIYSIKIFAVVLVVGDLKNQKIGE